VAAVVCGEYLRDERQQREGFGFWRRITPELRVRVLGFGAVLHQELRVRVKG
jgi:hypothetical protein